MDYRRTMVIGLTYDEAVPRVKEASQELGLWHPQ